MTPKVVLSHKHLQPVELLQPQVCIVSTAETDAVSLDFAWF